jgi:hypothetical protein
MMRRESALVSSIPGVIPTKIAVAIVKSAIERHRAFGIPLPEADEMEEEMRAHLRSEGRENR